MIRGLPTHTCIRSHHFNIPTSRACTQLVRVSRNGSVHWERGPNRHISVPGHVSSMLVTVSGGQPTVTEDSPPPDTVVDEAQKMLESLLREKYTLKSKVTGLERSLQVSYFVHARP